MGSDHIIALSHIVGYGIGLALVGAGLRRWRRRQADWDRTTDLPRGRSYRRSVRRSLTRVVRGLVRLATRLGRPLMLSIGLLCANRRYPLVAPVLGPVERRMAVLGHRGARAYYFPLVLRTFWLVRCSDCGDHRLFREVSSPDGAAIELRVLGASLRDARRCTVEYLTAGPSTSIDSATLPTSPRRRDGVQPATELSLRRGTTDKTA